ncbi:threonine/homoserine efflux transporter RhtA [Acinetobacter calcoaceticus]|uniref:Threonine/homoserine efflux transporter RhtA n=1 Tax=Acinetobacter calcoaceticus TaxID=471 RepID=A0A4R1XQ98_ACICA|nr:threonine/homoserine efflux transporter RhtA [Acinetobacter calcoaceticus]
MDLPLSSAIRSDSHISMYLKLVAVAFFWGGTFIAGRVITVDLPPHYAALIRFMIASIMLVMVVIKVEGRFPLIAKRDLVVTAAMGLTGICVYNVLFFGALSHIEAGRTALFVSFSPVLTVLVATFIFKEKLKLINYCGVALALIGTLIIVTRGDLFSELNQSFGSGEMMMSAAVLCWVAYTLLAKKSNRITPLLTTTYASLWGLLFLLLSALPNITRWTQLDISLLNWTGLFYLGALGTVLAFVWYAQGIATIGASKTIIFANLVPVFAVLLSFIILNEAITWSMLLGGLFTFFGVFLTNKK